jgi:hypothetical protein
VFISYIRDKNGAAFKRIDAGALAGWSAASPAFVVYVAGRTSTGVAGRTTERLVAAIDEVI